MELQQSQQTEAKDSGKQTPVEASSSKHLILESLDVSSPHSSAVAAPHLAAADKEKNGFAAKTNPTSQQRRAAHSVQCRCPARQSAGSETAGCHQYTALN